MMAKALELLFKNGEGKSVRFSIPEPVVPVDSLQVNAAMDLLMAKNIFTDELAEKVGARMVERTASDIALS
jgi:hypothetical protein